MKILALGDIHGRTIWQNIIKKEDSDHIIFLGDYFDSKENITGKEQLENFRKIITMKEQNPEKTILLFGNHDLHYIISEQYSGFQPHNKTIIYEAIQLALQKNFIQLCAVIDTFLFSHAGFTKTWCKNALGHCISDGGDFEKQVNDLFRTHPESFRFTIGQNLDFSGDDYTQPPTWVRPQSLLQDKLEGYTQIVGHTPQPQLRITESIAFIDTLGTSGEYLLIEDGILSEKL